MKRDGEPGASQYLHGTEPEEQARLSRLNDLLNTGSLRELSLRGDERILDVGSGLGQLTRAMARACPGGQVIAVERDPAQLATAQELAARAGEASLVEFRQGDAVAFPLAADEWGTFDLTHTRFLLEHVPDPVRVVQAMVQAVRPGGRIVLEDDDHDLMRLWPEPAGFAALWAAYQRSFELLGNDPGVGRRLVALLREAGAEPRRNTWIFFGGCAGEPNFPHYVANLIEVVAGARALVVAADLLGANEFDDTLATLREWGQRDDAAIWYAMAWAEGRRPLQAT